MATRRKLKVPAQAGKLRQAINKKVIDGTQAAGEKYRSGVTKATKFAQASKAKMSQVSSAVKNSSFVKKASKGATLGKFKAERAVGQVKSAARGAANAGKSLAANAGKTLSRIGGRGVGTVLSRPGLAAGVIAAGAGLGAILANRKKKRKV